jgi:hypothetical protein
MAPSPERLTSSVRQVTRAIEYDFTKLIFDLKGYDMDKALAAGGDEPFPFS